MKFPKGVRKTTKPSFRDHAGRGWWECDVVLPDGTKVPGHYECTRGTQFYFQIGFQWYSAPIETYDTQTPGATVITPDLRRAA